MNAVYIIAIVVQLFLIVCLLFIIRQLLFFNILNKKEYLPYVGLPRKSRKRILESGVLNGRSNIVDLGAGLGVFARMLRRAYPQARITGVEHSRLLALGARLRFMGIRNRPRIIRGDMFEHNIAEYDAIVGFWVSDFMPLLLEKFRTELPQHTVVVSNLFKFPQNDFLHEENIGSERYPIMVYRRK